MNRYFLFIFCISFLFVEAFVSTTECFAKDTKKFVVVLDAGHGGGDVGTPHRKCKKDEKTIALDVALRVGKMIEANNPDVKVVYTRKKDTYPSLPERTKIAKKAQGDLFISIHVNAAPDAAARGIETYVFGVTGLKGKSADEQKRIRERMANERENLDISGKQVDFDKDMDIETKILCQAQREKNNIYSEEVAKYVHNAMLYAAKRTSYKSNVKDRGVKQKNIFVLCYSPMPAILVELGYMSNPSEEKFINSEEGLTAFSCAIYDGFIKYKNSWNKRKLSNKDAFIEIVEKTPAKPTEGERVNQEVAKPKPEEEKTQKVIEENPIQDISSSSENNKVYYRIQFLTSEKLLKVGDKEFKGLSPVEHYKENGVYKYTYGISNNSANLAKHLSQLKKVFPDAFIIKTDAEGNRIR